MNLNPKAIISLVLATLLLSPSLVSAQVTQEKMMPTYPVPPTVSSTTDKSIVVTGYGRVTVKPDTATINFSIETETSPTNKEARAKLNQNLAILAKDLAKFGITSKDFVSTWYSAYPQYDYSTIPNGKISGYMINANYDIANIAVDKAESILEAINSSDVSRITSSSVNYYLKDSTASANEARKLAIQDAVTRSKTIASLLGVELAGISKVEDYFYPYSYYGGQNPESFNMELSLTVTYKIK